MFSLADETENISDERIQNDETIIINKLYCIDVSLPIFENRSAADFHVARFMRHSALHSANHPDLTNSRCACEIDFRPRTDLLQLDSCNSEQLYVIFDVICKLLKINALIIKMVLRNHLKLIL